MNKNEELAKRLKHWRKNKNHTQDSLADLSDMTRKAISSYENAKSFISYAAAKRLADALGISPLYLLCETDDPYETNSEYGPNKQKTLTVNESGESDKLPVFLWESLNSKNLSLEPSVDLYPKLSNCEGDFWLINKSTSLQPEIRKDDYLLISKTCSNLNDGDRVLFKINKKTDIMYLSKTDEYILLYPSNQNKTPVIVLKNNQDGFSIIGKITAFIRKMP